jgi:hypothetical protein
VSRARSIPKEKPRVYSKRLGEPSRDSGSGCDDQISVFACRCSASPLLIDLDKEQWSFAGRYQIAIRKTIDQHSILEGVELIPRACGKMPASGKMRGLRLVGVVQAMFAEEQLHPNIEAGLALAGSRRRHL